MYRLPLNITFYGNSDFVNNIGLSLCSKNTNSYIISGPRGVGKANFVYKLSKFILCHYEEKSKSDLKNKLVKISLAISGEGGSPGLKTLYMSLMASSFVLFLSLSIVVSK